ncbi:MULTISPECIES: polysaccharide deacetylase family protein [unclassified Virgibacillus]|uniref:polysaccharide deacetylase family protein n=1 Tax=unclassified Virgibacillus TaxID=2620237 RepID=UPI0024DEC1D4|nr:polysaccharide deacetylase family protein [Virgibacillus sp. LDC-1]
MKTFIYFLCVLIIYITFPFISYADTKDRFDYEKTGKVFWEVDTDDKIVAITFDDGPHPVYTPQILDLLNEYNAKATFFVTGEQAKTHPQLIYREHIEGHEVANHTYHHLSIPKDSKKLQDELYNTSYTIREITGKEPALYRPVGGNYNDLIINTAIDSGYLVVFWSWHQDPEDWKKPGTDKIVNHIKKNITPGDIILLHDSGGDRRQTVAALEKVLAFFKEEGYECLTVSEMLKRTNAIPFE